jgi:hypothetical protein
MPRVTDILLRKRKIALWKDSIQSLKDTERFQAINVSVEIHLNLTEGLVLPLHG